IWTVRQRPPLDFGGDHERRGGHQRHDRCGQSFVADLGCERGSSGLASYHNDDRLTSTPLGKGDHYTVHTLRKYLCWVFAFSSVVCLRLALSGLVRAVHRPYVLLPFRYLLINLSFAAVTTIFGMAWWTVWKGKRWARGWGIA